MKSMQQFVVPQFIDVEDKIIGPITTRQFIILLGTGLIIFVLFKLLLFWYFVIAGLFVFACGGALAFVRVNGQPCHFFLLNLIQTNKKPKLRIWNKERIDAELKAYIAETLPPPPLPKIRKEPLSASKLTEIALVLDTGGVYAPEE